MQKLSSINNSLISKLDPELAKAAYAAKIQEAFATAIRETMPSSESARYVLDHVQAVYVMKDDSPRKDGANQPIVLRIYSDDSVVRAEIDARQEWIRVHLARLGIRYDVCKIHASKFGMRERHPYKNLVWDDVEQASSSDIERHAFTPEAIDELVNRVSSPDAAAAMRAALEASSSTQGPWSRGSSNDSPSTTRANEAAVERLETLKRAICLSLGENAEAVLEKVNAASLEPIAFSTDEKRSRYQNFRCVIYSEDHRLARVIKAYDEQIRKDARRLGLRIQGSIRVNQTPESLRGSQAFPPLAPPCAISSLE